MTDTTDIKAMRGTALKDMFESQVVMHEKCSLGFVISLRNKAGGYSNEKIDDMWSGFKLAVAPEGGRTVGELALESNRLFDENKQLLDQLEAERQRADYLQRINGIQETTIEVFRHKELAELKGDQVPVGIFAGTDECSEVRHISWLSGASKLQAGDKLFTAPQKPVVLPSLTIGEVMHRSGYDRQYAEGWVSANDNAIREIKAAGGIVKDGE